MLKHLHRQPIIRRCGTMSRVQTRACAIMAYLGSDDMFKFRKNKKRKILQAFRSLRHRGPDASKLVRCNVARDSTLFMGFHQLHITNNDNTAAATQPMVVKKDSNTTRIIHCNGELYSHPQKDCLVLRELSPEHVLSNVEGEFAYGTVQYNEQTMWTDIDVFTDHLGVRPVFVAVDKQGLGWASEAKSLLHMFEGSAIRRLGPHEQLSARGRNLNEILHSVRVREKSPEHRTSTMIHTGYNSHRSEQDHGVLVREIMQYTVRKMVNHGSQPIGCLLSGGLDSSTVATIAASIYGPGLPTFSIGLPGSTDAPYARMVAQAIQSDHTHVEVNEADMQNAVESVIQTLESYDTTTVRASVPQYLLAKYIAENTTIKVLLGGDGSDELCAGYLYSHHAPSPNALRSDITRLLSNIHYYDALRGDRTMAAHGLEMRFPFLDREFVNYCLSIPPSLLMPSISEYAPHQHILEKRLFRDAFLQIGLPKEVCYRQKEAFSDGISSNTSMREPWYRQNSNETLASEQARYKDIFDRYFPNCRHLIPGYWLPQWCDQSDPSARALPVYQKE